MEKRLIRFLEKECHVEANSTILLAVSGGVDSMVMLELMRQTSYPIGIAHCNFQLRGAASDEDEKLVRQTAESADIPFFCKHFDTRGYASEHKTSIEMAARELRYDWFKKLAREHSYSYIATAHHNDDAIETFFLNLLRGTGIKGLHGILPYHDRIIRPMICFTRREIANYATEKQIVFHEDGSNKVDTYKRNFIRHHLIPMMRDWQPSFDKNMQQSMRVLDAQEKLYGELIRQTKEHIIQKDDSGYSVSKSELDKLPYKSTYLFEILHPFGFNYEHVRQILKPRPTCKGKKWFSHTHQLWETGTSYLIRPLLMTPAPINIRFESVQADSFTGFSNNRDIAYFDADKLSQPFDIRYWMEGDSFFPYGMQGKKKLSDFFNDLKIEGLIKKQIPILCNGNGDIIWIVGYRSDNRYRVERSTKTIMIARIDRETLTEQP